MATTGPATCMTHSDFVVRLLDQLLYIPAATYRKAMKISNKYSMEDVRGGMVSAQARLTFELGKDPLQVAHERLGLIFEFPASFWKTTAECAPDGVNCSIVTAEDIVPLQNRLDVSAVVLQFTANGGANGGKGCGMLDSFGFLESAPPGVSH